MKINIFTVADSVNVYEQGKLVIVGTFDNIQAEKCPFVFRPFGVAIKFSAEPRDYNKSYNVVLVLRKAGTNKPMIKLPFPINFPKPPGRKRIAAILATNIGGAKFNSFGLYVLELKVRAKVVSKIYLKVVKVKAVKKGKAARNKGGRKAKRV
jgi:hypothetical protein